MEFILGLIIGFWLACICITVLYFRCDDINARRGLTTVLKFDFNTLETKRREYLDNKNK